MPESDSLHDKYDRDERRLLDSAKTDLWADSLFDGIVDVAEEVFGSLDWKGVPAGAPAAWSNRSTAMLALGATGLRACRAAALQVRAGYGAEGFATLRRLVEAAGHAVNVAADDTGQYAANWLARRGDASSPRKAFGNEPEQQDMWKSMSGLVHVNFANFTNMASEFDDGGRLLHRVHPHRETTWDNAMLWYAGRQLARLLAAGLMLRPEASQERFLEAAGALAATEDRLAVELEALGAERSRRGPLDDPA